jgi:hypothetical protein
MAAWAVVDHTLRRWANALQRILRTLRLARAALVLGIAFVLLSAAAGLAVAAGWLDLRWFLVAYALASLFLIVPLVALAVLVTLPLRATSVVRLVDMGYPANARELAIRILARKLHEESIETEELLVDTALNEARKVMRRAEERRRQGGADRTDPDPPSPPPPGATL